MQMVLMFHNSSRLNGVILKQFNIEVSWWSRVPGLTQAFNFRSTIDWYKKASMAFVLGTYPI